MSQNDSTRPPEHNSIAKKLVSKDAATAYTYCLQKIQFNKILDTIYLGNFGIHNVHLRLCPKFGMVMIFGSPYCEIFSKMKCKSTETSYILSSE